MKKTGEWGEFFPSSYSHFGYNETIANDHYPLKKEAALKLGYSWFDNVQCTTGKETLALDSIPDSIDDVSDSITDEILACGATQRNYRITSDELGFYRKMRLPIPRKAFFARHAERLLKRHPRKLWKRITEDGKEVMTTYAPERPEKIYSDENYPETLY